MERCFDLREQSEFIKRSSGETKAVDGKNCEVLGFLARSHYGTIIALGYSS